jgi:hypothetical protein
MASKLNNYMSTIHIMVTALTAAALLAACMSTIHIMVTALMLLCWLLGDLILIDRTPGIKY